MKSTDLSSLNNHIFTTIELLLNNSDPNAEAKEKIDIESAKVVASLANAYVGGLKVQVQALAIMARTENPTSTKEVMQDMGLMDKSKMIGS